MATILFVEDDESVLALITDVLGGRDHEVISFTVAELALARLKQGGIDLVICDIVLPGKYNGFEFRDVLLDAPKLAGVPFMFLTAAPAVPGLQEEITRRMAKEVVVFKPINIPSFRRLIDSMLGDLPREEGPVSATALAGVFRNVSRQKLSGALTLFRGEVTKKVIFRDGVLAFAISNEPEEYIGQALVRAGLVSEQGLQRLFEERGDEPVRIGEVFLKQHEHDTADRLDEILRKKVREAVLDSFLWTKGRYEVFYGGVHKSEVPFTADLSIDEVAEEGLQRAKVWRKVTALLPNSEASFDVSVNGVPEAEQKSQGEQLLVFLLKEGFSLGQIYLEMRGQHFAVGVKIAQWLRLGYIQPAAGYTYRTPAARAFDKPMKAELAADPIMVSEPFSDVPTEPPPDPPGPDAAGPFLADGEALFQAGALQEARWQFTQALELDAGNPLALARIASIDGQLTETARGSGLSPVRVVKLLKEPSADMSLHPDEYFVISRLAVEPITVEALTQVCPLTESQVLRILMRLIAHGIASVE